MIAEAQGVFAETRDSQLATKFDLLSVERGLDGLGAKVDHVDAKIDHADARLCGELNLLKWMLGFLIAAVMTIVVKTFF